MVVQGLCGGANANRRQRRGSELDVMVVQGTAPPREQHPADAGRGSERDVMVVQATPANEM